MVQMRICKDIADQANAQGAIQSVDAAIGKVSTERGKFGAVSNRLGSTINNLDQVAVNLTASQGRIQDADFAGRDIEFGKKPNFTTGSHRDDCTGKCKQKSSNIGCLRG